MSASRERVRLTFYSDAEYFGGAEAYLTVLARHLDPRSYELSLVLPASPGSRTLEERMRALGAAIHHLPRPGFRWMPLIPEMIRVFREAGGGILHLNLPSAYDAGVSSVAWAARMAGYRSVVSTEHLPMIERRYRKFPMKVFFSHWVDRSIVVASINRSILVRLHGIDPDKVLVIPNGVEEPEPLSAAERARLRAAWGVTEEEPLLGIVARLTPRKGHRLLLESLARVRQESPRSGFRLAVVGEGEDEEALHDLARSLDLTGRIVWLGQRADAPRLMRAFDLFVLPSSVEAMPLTVLEAMAAGVAVIATSVYGLPEVVTPEETGLLVPAGDAGALCAAIRRLVESPADRDRMGRAGRRRYLDRFTAERMAQETEAVYRRVEPRAAAVAA